MSTLMLATGTLWLLMAAPASEPASSESLASTSPTVTESDASSPTATRWLDAFVPQRGQWELGVLSGLAIVGARHDYYDPDTAPQVALGRVAPVAGLRAAYFPLSLLGVEAEGWGLWTRVPSRGDAPAFAYALRAHAIVQLPMYRVVPFVLGGYGITGIRSPLDAVGNDVDPAGHYGLGVKLLADSRFAVRLEGRHMMTPARARRRQVANHFSIMVGLSVRLGPEPTSRPVRDLEPAVAAVDSNADRDGDHVRDDSDACPELAGVFPHGCPRLDFDDDGIPDEVDACPNEAGQGNGCPVKDTDGDGWTDGDDRCPWEAGVAPDGCRAPDLDSDGVADAEDACPAVAGQRPSGCLPIPASVP